MGIFDELGLKPGDSHRIVIQRELRAAMDRWSRTGYAYEGGGDFMLQHGRHFHGRELPAEWQHVKGPENQCFDNARAAVLAEPTLRYVEGLYCPTAGRYVNHGWCIDANDEVVEVTYPTDPEVLKHSVPMNFRGLSILPPQHWGYWGVVFNIDFVRWHEDEHGLPMLPRSQPDLDTSESHGLLDMSESHDYPLLKQTFDPARTSL